MAGPLQTCHGLGQNIYIDSIFTSIRLSWETEHTWDRAVCLIMQPYPPYLSAAPWTVARQAPLSMEFSTQERTGESGVFGMWPNPRVSSRISS